VPRNKEELVRKVVIGAITGAAFFAIVAIAIASVNSVSYTATVKEKGKPSKAKPANVAYTGVLDVSRPDGSQPDSAPDTDVFLAKGYVSNGKLFKSCNASDIDGKTTVPAKCKAAVVGSGNASAKVGTPGRPSQINESLTVTAYNGAKGKQVLLVLNAQSPVPIKNRVIVGTLSSGGSGFAFKVTFHVPPDLQHQLGSEIALTHFNVTFSPAKTVKVKSHGTTLKESYFVLTGCPASKKLANKGIVHFNQDNGQPGGEVVESDGTYACT
jgi:hypothetical protein